MIKLLAALLTLCGLASAETYHFDGAKGAIIKHDHRCASPSATKRLKDFIDKNPDVTIGHDQMTAAVGDTISGADVVLADDGRTWGWWHLTDKLTVIIYVHPKLDACRDPHKCLLRADTKVVIIQRFEDATCFEQWSGTGDQL